MEAAWSTTSSFQHVAVYAPQIHTKLINIQTRSEQLIKSPKQWKWGCQIGVRSWYGGVITTDDWLASQYEDCRSRDNQKKREWKKRSRLWYSRIDTNGDLVINPFCDGLWFMDWLNNRAKKAIGSLLRTFICTSASASWSASMRTVFFFPWMCLFVGFAMVAPGKNERII